jgi:membrane protease YdiL (CAAX protease family)
MSNYLEVARTGKNDWWRYLLSLPGIIGTWLVLGLVPVFFAITYVQMDGNPATNFTETGFTGLPLLVEFLVTMSTFVPFIVATLLAVRFIHARSLRTLITAEPRIRWGRVLAGAGVWFVIVTLMAVVEFLLYPGRYVLTFRPVELLIFAIFALLLIPVQTSAEEIFFRGYLLQWMGLRLKNKWVLSFLNGVLFFLPHTANPEMAVDSILVGLGYFIIGFIFTLITVQDNGMELALGMHAANNLFAVLFANYTVTALRSPSLFTVQELDPVYSLVSLIVGSIIFFIVYFTLLVPEPQNAHSEEDRGEAQ